MKENRKGLSFPGILREFKCAGKIDINQIMQERFRHLEDKMQAYAKILTSLIKEKNKKCMKYHLL